MVLFVQRWAIAASFLFLSLMFCSTAQAAPGTTLELTVKVSSESAWASRLGLPDSGLLQALEHPEQRSSATEIPATDTYLTSTSNGHTTTYVMDTQGYLYSESPMERLELKRKWSAVLLKQAAKLREAHYGTIVEWEQAKQLVPKLAKFKVTDMETGLSFHVQRRAGSSHADVQPLTKEDTAVMKKIYGGAWSWARRSILVETEGHKLAASMHGMPHGGDGIPDNDFSGHFCIHFLGSTTHRSGKVDPDHQLMIYKAGGKIGDYLNQASPDQLIDTFFLAINMREKQIARMTFAQGKQQQLVFFLQSSESAHWDHENKGAAGTERDADDALAIEIPVDVRMKRTNHKDVRLRMTFELKRGSITEPWKIASIGMVS